MQHFARQLELCVGCALLQLQSSFKLDLHKCTSVDEVGAMLVDFSKRLMS